MIPVGRVHLKGLTTRAEDLRALERILAATRGETVILSLRDGEQVRYCTFLDGRAHSALLDEGKRFRPLSAREFAEPIRAGRAASFAFHEGSALALLYTSVLARDTDAFSAPAHAVNAAELIAAASDAGLAALRDETGTTLAYIEAGKILRVEGVDAGDDPHAAFLKAVAESSRAAVLRLFTKLSAKAVTVRLSLAEMLHDEIPPTPLVFVGPDGNPVQREGEEILIGRAPDCDVVVRDSSVSRRHALLRWETDHYVLIDLGSSLGTRVADHDAVEGPTWIKAGDRLHLGDVEIQVRAPTDIPQETGDNAPREARGPIAPYLICHSRASPIDRRVFRVTTGSGGDLELRGAPGIDATLVVDGVSVILHADAGAEQIRINNERFVGKRRLFSGDRIEFGRVPCVFALMQPPPRARSNVDAVLAAFVQEP